DNLMEEQLAATEDIVERWNGWEGPTPETKARNAAKYGYKYVQNFVMEMWSMDFNNEITDGIPFNNVHTPEGSWQEYLGETFEELGTLLEHDGLACRNPSSAVPFKNFGHHQVEMIAACHLLEGFTFDHDPSHMWTTTATQLLSFWHKQQESHPNDVFGFQKWIDQSGELQPLVHRTLVPLQVVRQWKYQKTPVPKCKKNPGRKNGKGKGKVQEVGVVDDSADDSADYSVDDSLDDHSKAEVSCRRQNRAKTPFPSHSHSNPPPTDGSHTHAKTPVHHPQNNALTDDNGRESNGHDSDDEADEDTYLPTLSNSKKLATSLNTNPDLHSGRVNKQKKWWKAEIHPEAHTQGKFGHVESAVMANKFVLCVKQALSELTSANVKQGIPGRTWKSPHVRKAPARPDADVPSPDAKRLCKQTGSN
ncbi:hypothetical protein F5J12DRAFT_963487, partial [Pisolithus orientalis]|uniref:uncharacterized protein n=1 Tax=Pisolithus orientalis TaxID=936130 RepID=UPI00222583C4